MKKGLNRREFLHGIGASLVGLSLVRLQLKGIGEAVAAEGYQSYPYRTWEDIYRTKWTWDKVVRVTHPKNCWYQIHCAWDAYIKDGIVIREEQSAEYPQTRPELPDYNPRGCQKGACYSHRMYDPSRIKYPLKRVGKRGEGRWQKVSWEEALTEIADTIIDVAATEG